MRIVSLLPSATEIAFALGLGESLVGVTHLCDWPVEASTKQRVTSSLLPAGATPRQIDELVRAHVDGGAPTEDLDLASIADLDPDLILSQDLCHVCAVPAGEIGQALTALGCRSSVVSLDPHSLTDIFTMVQKVGDAADRAQVAARVGDGLRRRLEAVRSAVADAPRPRVLVLEWGDPPFNAGHWIPEMVEAAGADAVLAESGGDSVRVTWEQVREAQPDVVVYAPCGYHLENAEAEASSLVLSRPEIGAAQVYAVDADGLFVRPGPRVVDGVEALAAALHPDRFAEPAPSGSIRRLA